MARTIGMSSWQFQGGTSHFNKVGDTCFMEMLFNGNGQVRSEFWFTMLDDTPIAYLFGVMDGGKYFVVDVAFDDKYDKLSPGRVLYCHVIENLMDETEFDAFDFGGDGGYKKEYSTFKQPESDIVIYNSSLYSKSIRTLREFKLYSRIRAWKR